MLSDQLRNLANKARQGAEMQMGAGMANIGSQVNQAMAASTPAGRPMSKSSAQQLAGAATGAQQNLAVQTQQQLGGQLQQLGQQALGQQRQMDQQRLVEKQALNDSQIAELQRSGVIRQNSKELAQAKQLQADEIESQKRMLNARLQFDDKISFLTNKQRKDLAELGAYTKQQIFDSRLTFQQDEMGRKFTNLRQLADYAVASYKDDQKLGFELQAMQQAAQKEFMVLEHAHKMITQKMQLEFQRAEKQKDYALLKKLQKMKADLQEKMARKQAQASAISNIIVGGATIAGAVAGAGVPGGAIIGASIGKGAGELATGAAQGAGWY